MNDCLMWRYIDTAVLFRAGQSEHVVILIDRTTDRTQRVVAVRQYVWHRKFFQPRCARRLDDTHKRDVVGGQLVKFDLQLVHRSGRIVILQNRVGNRLLCRLFSGRDMPADRLLQLRCRIPVVRNDVCAIHKIGSCIIQSDHTKSSCFLLFS